MAETRRSFLVAVAAALLLPGAALADSPAVYAPGGKAIEGYDTVAYFVEGRAVPGSAEFALMWRGAVWHFASARSLSAFEMDPAGYAPQFGGYCAYAISGGELVTGDPESFAIHDGRLYLNHNAAVLRMWQSDVVGHIIAANNNWPQILKR